ncbi:MAG TPA: TrmJ/YjtD family RNA methyltransferase [Terriglobia bacterium]|nr:TrmJ/YjtD family RNA methyltransferase [Terriglobia bacterium]
MKPLKLNWRIVLVRPRNPLNIGAAARALANFGLLELAVVAPFEPTWDEARQAAVGADTVIAAARAVPSLADILSDSTLVIGTTTGSRRNLGRELLPLPELATWLRRRRARGIVALLFGSEKTGLSNEDLSRCHALLRIPTTLDCPSMNLGQAVAVCAYELARSGVLSVRPAGVTTHRSDPANLQTLDHVFERAVQLLDVSGYLRPKSRAATLLKLRRLLLDLNLTRDDARILGGVLSQVEWKLESEIGRR